MYHFINCKNKFTEVSLRKDADLVLPGGHFALLKKLDDQEAGLFAEGEGKLCGIGRGGSGYRGLLVRARLKARPFLNRIYIQDLN